MPAAFLGIRIDSFSILLRDNPEVRDAWDKGKALGQISLRRKQFRLAGDNSAMAIFLGKQILKQRDMSGLEISGPDEQPIDLSGLSKEERLDLRKLLDKGSEQESGS